MVGTYYIIGAGISGLVLGYELLKKGCKVIFIEKADTAGGMARSFIWHGIPCDLGPHIYHTPDEDVKKYWKTEFGDLLYEKLHWSKNWIKGKYYDYPISWEMIESLPDNIRSSIKNELNTIKGKSINGDNVESYYDYIRSIAGPTLQQMFFLKYPEKIWGISTKDMDSNWAPKRIEIRETYKPFHDGQYCAVGTQGSGAIISKLVINCEKLGVEFRYNCSLKGIIRRKNRITSLKTDGGTISIGFNDVVINTISAVQTAAILNIDTDLENRGVILVYLLVNKTSIFPDNVSFVYYDDPSISFYRISEQSNFVKEFELKESNIYICEVSLNQQEKRRDTQHITASVIKDFIQLGYAKKSDILDSKTIIIPETYPILKKGWRKEFNKLKTHTDSIANFYTLGSLAEFAYADLQILFSKSKDLVDVLTDHTLQTNNLSKNIPKVEFSDKIFVGDRIIGKNQPAFIIAEIGLNHNGNPDLAKRLMDEAVEAGADAVKLQTYSSSSRVSPDGRSNRYVERILGIEETDYEMLKKYELTGAETKALFQYAKGKIPIFSTPFDLQSVDLLESLEVECYKIASFDLLNFPLLKKVADTGKPIIISTGASYLNEVELALRSISSITDKIILLHCVSSYPCTPESMNLNSIKTMSQSFNILVGLSDHSLDDLAITLSIPLGAAVLEKHFTLNKNMEGPDHASSYDPVQFKRLVRKIRLGEAALGDGIKQPHPAEFQTMLRFKKTLYAARNITKGERITMQNLSLKGPAFGISPRYLDVVLGMTAMADIETNSPITWEKLQGTPE